MAEEPNPAPPIVPGWRTSEGIIQAVTQLLAIVVGLGLMTRPAAESLGAAASALGAAVAAVVSAWSAIRYSQARTELKMAVNDAAAANKP